MVKKHFHTGVDIFVELPYTVMAYSCFLVSVQKSTLE